MSLSLFFDSFAECTVTRLDPLCKRFPNRLPYVGIHKNIESDDLGPLWTWSLVSNGAVLCGAPVDRGGFATAASAWKSCQRSVAKLAADRGWVALAKLYGTPAPNTRYTINDKVHGPLLGIWRSS